MKKDVIVSVALLLMCVFINDARADEAVATQQSQLEVIEAPVLADKNQAAELDRKIAAMQTRVNEELAIILEAMSNYRWI